MTAVLSVTRLSFSIFLYVELSEREDVVGVDVVGGVVEGSDQSWSGCVSIS